VKKEEVSKERFNSGPLRLLASRGWLPLFFLLMAAFCICVLSMPLFPSQDGPNHLFDAYIFGKLLTHSPTVYSSYYFIRYLFPPYSVHYYLLVALMKVASPLLADKLVVCLIIITFCCGLRYLAKGIGPSGNVLSLFAFAIVLNWPLAMGFENFCLALAMDLWALGLWVRFAHDRALAKRTLFVLLSFLIALTHPVALPLLVLFCGMDLALRSASSLKCRPLKQDALEFKLADLVTLLCSGCFIFYIALFIDNHAAGSNKTAPYSATWTMRTYPAMYGLAFFGKHGIESIFYRALLILVFFIAIYIAFAAVRQRSGISRLGQPESFLAITLLTFIVLPFVPRSINDPYYLVVRMLVVVWVGAIASASGHRTLNRQTQAILALTATVIALLILAIGVHRVYPIAHRIAIVQKEERLPEGSIGICIPGYEGSDYTYPVIYSLPYEWGCSHYFRENNAVMLNAPWMDSTYFPMGPKPALLTGKVNFAILQQPIEFRKELVQSKELQDLVFPHIHFIFFSDPEHSATPATIGKVLQLDPKDHWACHHNDWYTICRKTPLSSNP